MISFDNTLLYFGRGRRVVTFSGSLFGIKKSTLFQAFKYGIYLIILYNVSYFVIEDYLSSAHRYRDGVSLSEIGDAFAQAMDSLAWLILLLMFELETWVIDDTKFHGSLKWTVNTASAICYVFIVIAFTGYFDKLLFVLNFTPTDYAVACDMIGPYLSYSIDTDEFHALTSESCQLVGNAPYFANEASRIIADAATYDDMILLGYTEVINAATWLLVVIMLWIDVYLQIRGQLSPHFYRISAMIKIVLYLVLIAAAVIWWQYGNFMDFWDAFIWIVAFFFIEMNIVQWNEETSHSPKPVTKTASNNL